MDKEYTDLNKKIDSYLNRMPSESLLILNSIDDLNSYYENIHNIKYGETVLYVYIEE